MEWNPTGQVPPGELADARLELHYGALVLGSVAHSVLPHAEDDSHTNLGVIGDALRTHGLDAAGELTLDLEMSTLVLALRDRGRDLARLELEGKTLDEALRWTAEQLRGPLGADVSVSRREYPDFPDSPVGQGGAFSHPGQAQLAELAAWFQNGHRLLETLRDDPALSPTRVWPHHFDVGGLLQLDERRSIGLGLSPGDEHYDQPYFYCSPYPQPGGEDLPTLAAGAWHTSGFTSAVVTAEQLQATGSPATAAEEYLASSVAACRELLSSS